MTARYTPGSDDTRSATPNAIYRPANGAGGVFARWLKGATPKYAVNEGPREEMYRNTMARMFVRVDHSEYNLFRDSVTDAQAKRLVGRLAGDPTRPYDNGQGYNDTGYMDFVLQHVHHTFREKVQAAETLSDNYVAYYFGQGAPVWQYTGALINTVQDDQASSLVRLYLHVLRGTQLARRQKIITLRYDSYAVAGSIESLDWDLDSANETLCPFAFTFRVKQLRFINTTVGWTPTQPNGAIADPDSVAYDGGRPRSQGSVLMLFGSTPPDTVPGPTGEDPPSATTPADAPPVAAPGAPASTPNFTPNPNPDVRATRPAVTSGGPPTGTPAALYSGPGGS